MAFTLIGGDYEHTLGFAADDPSLHYRCAKLPAEWARVRAGAPFDAIEFSLSNLIMMRARGDDALRALPIFPNRPFSHIALRVAKDSPIRSPAEFRGRRIGVPDYSMTAAVWARQILWGEFGVHWNEIQWVSGAKQRFAVPADAAVELTTDDVEALCLAGQLDGLVIPHPRDDQLPLADRRLRSAIADNEAYELLRFRATGNRPINHCVAISSAALARDPTAPVRLFEAYVQAKRRALARRLGSTFLPWGETRWAEMLSEFNSDPMPYGLTPSNLTVVAGLIDMLFEQGLIQRRPSLEEIFAPGSLSLQEMTTSDAPGSPSAPVESPRTIHV